MDFVIEKEIQKRVKSGALCGATTATKRASTIALTNINKSDNELSPAAKQVLQESYRRVREGNITQVTPLVKQASTTKSAIPASWKNWDNQFNNTRKLEKPTQQLKSASTNDGIPASYRNYIAFGNGIRADSLEPNTQAKGRVLSASEKSMPASWINYRRLVEGSTL